MDVFNIFCNKYRQKGTFSIFGKNTNNLCQKVVGAAVTNVQDANGNVIEIKHCDNQNEKY